MHLDTASPQSDVHHITAPQRNTTPRHIAPVVGELNYSVVNPKYSKVKYNSLILVVFCLIKMFYFNNGLLHAWIIRDIIILTKLIVEYNIQISHIHTYMMTMHY